MLFCLFRHKDHSALDPIELVSTLTSYMTPGMLTTKDEFGNTALHCAAYRGASVCCMHLLQKGASLKQCDNENNTPLARAVLGKHER